MSTRSLLSLNRGTTIVEEGGPAVPVDALTPDDIGTAAGTVAAGDDDRIVGAAQKAANLADLGNVVTARTNLGLGGAAQLEVGTSAGTVAAGDDTRFADGIPLSDRGVANGVASLDAGGKVPAGQSLVASVAGRTGAVTLTAADVGLSNVDNTADANKPVSSAQAAADTAAKARGNHTGTQTAATISDFSAAADARITAQKGAASGLAPLGSDSKIATTYLPAIAITSVFTAASQAAQLALTAQEGDVAIRTDVKQTFIHNGGSAGTIADWTQLETPTDAVISVAGQTGVVVLAKTDVGLSNVDDTSDVNKPVSTAQATADGLRVAKSGDTMSGDLNFGASNKVVFGGDTNLYRLAADRLATDDQVMIQRPAGTAALAALLSTDTVNRFQVNVDGTINWGPGGTGALDTALYRGAANVLTTDDTFTAVSGLASGNASVFTLERVFAVAFGAGANYKADIYIPGGASGFGVTFEVTLTGQYGGANAAGVVSALYSVEVSSGGVFTTNFMTYTAVQGTTPTYFGLLAAAWDATNSRVKLTIVHRTAEINTVFASVKVYGTNYGYTNVRDGMGVSAPYNTDVTTVSTPAAQVGPNVSIGAVGPSSFPGIVISDTNLYRNTTDNLRTDDSLQVMGANGITADLIGGTSGTRLTLRPGSANSSVSELRVGNGATGTSLTFCSETGTADTTLYRSAADKLATDDDFLVNTAGKGLRVKEGSNAKQGTSTLVAGSVVVANTSVTATSRIFLTGQIDGGTPGWLRVSTRTAGTSFTITSSSATDTSTVAWQIFEPA